MNEKKTPKRNILNLIIGLAFLGYGLFRLSTYYSGIEYSNLRIVIFLGFIIIGVVDIYRYLRPW